jgi:hypothetical protein
MCWNLQMYRTSLASVAAGQVVACLLDLMKVRSTIGKERIE